MKDNRILIIKSDKDDYEKFFIKNMDGPYATCKPIYRKSNSVFYLLSLLWIQILKIPGESIWYGNWKREIKKYDTIIVFDRVLSWKILKYIRKNNRNARIIVWFWNPIKSYNQMPNEPGVELWSFDPSNCKKYNLHYNSQFYVIPENKVLADRTITNKLDSQSKKIAYFLGLDKNRSKILINIKNELQKHNVYSYFHILRDCTSKNNCEFYTNEKISYIDNVAYINNVDVLVDIPQDGQSGMTLRQLEGLFYGKKVITTDSTMKNTDIFTSGNVYIYDQSKEKQHHLADFVFSPVENNEITEELKIKYSFKSWLGRFFCS